jgi:EpsI family protein
MSRTAWLVPAALVIQAGLVHCIVNRERPPAIPDLSRLETHLGPWQSLGDDRIGEGVRAQLQADQIVSRTYVRDGGRKQAHLLVAWFQTQNHGARQPHSPQVCMPGQGWTPVVTDRVRITAAGETISSNRYVVTKHGDTMVALYWYQIARRAVASEWASKGWTVWDAVTQRRTDIALVRVLTQARGGDYGAATAEGAAFVEEFYPKLRAALPR